MFLSTIPSIKPKNWPEYYGYIRRMVQQGKVVVFSLLDIGMLGMGLVNEFALSFKDVARAEYISFKETPLTVHVKLTPCDAGNKDL